MLVISWVLVLVAVVSFVLFGIALRDLLRGIESNATRTARNAARLEVELRTRPTTAGEFRSPEGEIAST